MVWPCLSPIFSLTSLPLCLSLRSTLAVPGKHQTILTPVRLHLWSPLSRKLLFPQVSLFHLDLFFKYNILKDNTLLMFYFLSTLVEPEQEVHLFQQCVPRT